MSRNSQHRIEYVFNHFLLLCFTVCATDFILIPDSNHGEMGAACMPRGAAVVATPTTSEEDVEFLIGILIIGKILEKCGFPMRLITW